MPLDSDAIVDRRRLRRSLALWRVLALLLVGGFVALFGLYAARDGIAPKARPHVARVEISGLILDDRERLEMLERLEKNESAKGVILAINSPGGGVAASEKLFKAIRRIAEKKPTVAVFGSMAASGGYLAAIGADRIIGPETTLTGSIGVLIQYPNVSGLLGKLGVDVEAIKSSPLKAAPNGYEPTSPEARAAMQSVVNDTFAWFKGLVGQRRGLAGADLDRVSDGRIFTGHQALALRLIDALGDEEAARDWLATRGVDRDLTVRDWKAERSGLGLPFVDAAAAAVARSLGLTAIADRLAGGRGLPGADLLGLDGLVAVWHPGQEN